MFSASLDIAVEFETVNLLNKLYENKKLKNKK